MNTILNAQGEGSGRLCPPPPPSHKVYSFIWLLPFPKTNYQGPAIKVLKSSNQKSLLGHLINMSN